jgi:hypothetical protein
MAAVKMPGTVWSGDLAPADTIVYEIRPEFSGRGRLAIDAYSMIDPSGQPTFLWSLSITEVELDNPWTFATHGVMYVAGLDANGGYVIIPLRVY